MGFSAARCEQDIDDLVAQLSNPQRREPWCVITSNLDGDWEIGPQEIADQTSGLCEVWAVKNGPLSYKVAERLPIDANVFGGAARTYPLGIALVANPALAVRRMRVKFHTNAGSFTDSVLSDIQSMAYKAGLLDKKTGHCAPATGTIKSFFAEGARASSAQNPTSAPARSSKNSEWHSPNSWQSETWLDRLPDCSVSRIQRYGKL